MRFQSQVLNPCLPPLACRPDEVGAASFDKDDDLAVEIVTAASNLRAACYGIPAQSLFAAKGMAGNIIHAIATTNAIISGLIVTEACKILAGADHAGTCSITACHHDSILYSRRPLPHITLSTSLPASRLPQA